MKAFFERHVSDRWVIHAVVIAGLLCLGILSSLLWLEWRERFPSLADGSYAGTLHGAVRDAPALPIFVESARGHLFFAPAHADWQPRAVERHERAGAALADLPPVTLSGARESIQLIGGRTGEGRYAGVARNLDTGESGGWDLVRIFGEVSPLSSLQREEVASWLRVRDELADVEEKIARASLTVAEQKDQLDKLTGFVTEKGKLRATAAEKFRTVEEQLTAARRALADSEARAEALVKKLDIALRVTPAGKLVYLARESLDREGRWIRSALRSEIESTTPGFSRAVERGQEILRLKREIGYERARIRRLLEEQRSRLGGRGGAG